MMFPNTVPSNILFSCSGLIFGLSEEQSKYAILGAPRKLLIASEARRHGRAGLIVSYRPNAVDSDDYSESELEESSSDDEEESEGNNSDSMQSEEPPRKIVKLNES